MSNSATLMLITLDRQLPIPGMDVNEGTLLTQITRVEQLILRVGWLEQRRFAQDLRRFGLTAPQFFVLRAITLSGQEPPMTELAESTLLGGATMTGIVGRLARMGLVSRHRAKEDRRKVLVDLTPLGRDVLRQVQESRRSRMRGILERLSPGDARELLRLLGAYLQAFGAEYEDEDMDVAGPAIANSQSSTATQSSEGNLGGG